MSAPAVIVTTNLPFESWTEVLGSERLTGATLDRLTHRCRIIETKGESYRLSDAKARTRSTRQPRLQWRRPRLLGRLTIDRRAAVFDDRPLLFWMIVHKRPIAIKWRLRDPLPGDLFADFGAAAVA